MRLIRNTVCEGWARSHSSSPPVLLANPVHVLGRSTLPRSLQCLAMNCVIPFATLARRRALLDSLTVAVDAHAHSRGETSSPNVTLQRCIIWTKPSHPARPPRTCSPTLSLVTLAPHPLVHHQSSIYCPAIPPIQAFNSTCEHPKRSCPPPCPCSMSWL